MWTSLSKTRLVMTVLTLLAISLVAMSWRRQPLEAASITLPDNVTFKDVKGIFPPNCEWCHDFWPKEKTNGFYMGSYAALIEGAYYMGKQQPEILRGDAARSRLVQHIEGTRRPRMPLDRDPLSDYEIQLIRKWIDQGARADEQTPIEHVIELPNVKVTLEHHTFYLSCRSPKDVQNMDLRVKMIDELTGKVIAYEWPLDGGGERSAVYDLGGRWFQWKVDVDPKLMKFPGTVTVKLYVNGSERSQWNQDDKELNGVIFVLDQGPTPEAELKEYTDFKSIPAPEQPPNRSVLFSYVLQQPSDVSLAVYADDKTQKFNWTDKDQPKGIRRIVWNFATANPLPKTGWYTARIRCQSRTPNKFQPDMAVMFLLNTRY